MSKEFSMNPFEEELRGRDMKFPKSEFRPLIPNPALRPSFPEKRLELAPRRELEP